MAELTLENSVVSSVSSPSSLDPLYASLRSVEEVEEESFGRRRRLVRELASVGARDAIAGAQGGDERREPVLALGCRVLGREHQDVSSRRCSAPRLRVRP